MSSLIKKEPVVETVSADLTVIGGGIAGCSAAIAAARLGLRTVLVQNRPVLGGNASSEIGILMAGADRDFTHSRETGIVEEIDLVNRYHNYEVQWRNCVADATLEFMVRNAGVSLFLNTHAYKITMRDDAQINSVTGAQQGTERGFEFRSPLFVDASGDGAVAMMAGARYRMGSEAKEEFNEELASDDASDVTMGSTLMFRVKKTDAPVPFRKPDWAHHYPNPEDLPCKIRSLERPQLWIEHGAKLDTIKDNVTIREELLKILYGVWDHIKNHGDYGAENHVISWVGSVPGKRESRRIVGDYILSENDLVNPTEYGDAVAYGGWPIDVHSPDGFHAKKKWLNYKHLDKPYPIPYRCYYSKNIENLFMAGRIISATHVAHGSTRLIRTCSVGGQAVGTAAYVCRKYNESPRSVGLKRIEELRQLLLRYDCHIPEVRNQDPLDLARKAREVTASSEHVDPKSGNEHSAAKVVEGVSRGNGQNENLWMSNQLDRNNPPPTIELKFDETVKVSSIQLTFDTMIREQRFFDRPVFGPLPTCVSDYRIEAKIGDQWRLLKSEKGNFLRHRIHRFNTIETDCVRVRVYKTNGDPHARIYEIRLYDDDLAKSLD